MTRRYSMTIATALLLAGLVLVADARPRPQAASVPTLTLSGVVESGPTRTYRYELATPTPLPAGTTLILAPLRGVLSAKAAPHWAVSQQQPSLVQWVLVQEDTKTSARYFSVVAEAALEPGIACVFIDGVEVGTVVGPAMFY